MSAVNVAAERGSKLSSNIVTSSKNEDTYQDNLQSIESNSKQVPNLTIMNGSRKSIVLCYTFKFDRKVQI